MQLKYRHKLKTAKDNQFFRLISEEAKKSMKNIKQIDNRLDTAQLVCTKSYTKERKKIEYNFSKFMFLLKFA